jgi:hypothetical protein
MTMRSKTPQPLAFRPPASQWRHIGLDPCFIDENQPARIEKRLLGSPALTPSRYVGASLLRERFIVSDKRSLKRE